MPLPFGVLLEVEERLSNCTHLSKPTPSKQSTFPSSSIQERIATLGERSTSGTTLPSDAGLRLALAAALQGGAGGAAGFDAASGSRTVARLLSGLDAGGVDSYADRLLASFQSPLGGRGATANGATANGAADSSDSDSDEDDDEEGGAAAAGPDAAEAARGRALEQLCAALRFPAASDALVARGLAALAAAAFLEVPAGADCGGAEDAGGKKKQKKGGKAAGGGADIAAALKVVAGATAPELSPRVRNLCAARLVTLLHSVGHKTQRPQPQQQQGDKDKDGGNKKDKAAAAAAAAAAAHEAARARQEALLCGVLTLVERAQAVDGVRLAQPLPPAAEAALQGLRDLSAALAPLAAGACAANAAPRLRARALLQLSRLLQLQLLFDPAGFDARLVPDLLRVAAEGAGVRGLDAAVAAATAAADGSDDSDADGSGSDDEAAGPAHWADLLLDVLLALLSGAPAGGDAGGGAALPTAPLREAAEGLFRASAEELTAGGLQDLLRVLGQRADEAGLLQEGDEDEDGEVEEGGSSSSEEEEEEDDEEEAAAAPPSKAQKQQKQQQQQAAGAKRLRDAAGSDDDDEEDASSDEGMDDETMLRLDAQLGAYVKSMLARGGSSARERTAALRNLQLRAAALLEDWLRRCGRSAAAVAVAGPLLRALATAARPGGSQPLAERLRGVAVNRLAKARPDLSAAGNDAGDDDEAAEELRAALKAALY